MEWHSTDPRYDISKRATIVILRPGLTGAWESGIGYVETDHGYYVQMSFSGGTILTEHDLWPEGWIWIEAPERL